MTEQVLVVDNDELLSDSPSDYIPKAYFINRDIAEIDESKKQIIPYVAVLRGDKILAYQRSNKGKEDRLQGKWSIGFGGHVNPEDLVGEPVDEMSLFYAINRELTEELEWGDIFEGGWVLSAAGTIYDDSNSVGKVHYGIAFKLELENTESEYPKVAEDEIATIKWVSLKEAVELPNLEEWSKIFIEKYMEKEDD